jgi:endoglucanase
MIMKIYKAAVSFIFIVSLCTAQQSWIRVNQLGYQEKAIKVAVLGSKENITITSFSLCDAMTEKSVATLKTVKEYGPYGPFQKSYRLDFSGFSEKGAYFLTAAGVRSPNFRIADDVYDGTADFLLNYMREQRSGYNPYLKDSCHTHDGFIIYHPTLDSTHIDVSGGWHDASDYLQYVTTSATATFQMMFAYQQNASAFTDRYDKNGDPGSNGIPDILDEAKWGLDWLMKMNPKNEMMFNQIADDRDHRGFRLPTLDTISYGKGLERPVYFCTGKPQGVYQHKNRATGIASTAGKFSSAFALGAQIMKPYYPQYAENLKQKAIDAYHFGIKNPGVCQTAPCRAPYFYEEDNYADDMELAATQMYQLTGEFQYIVVGAGFGNAEPITPWMGADTARHYQWYPFVNLGHYFLGLYDDEMHGRRFIELMRKGIDTVFVKAQRNPFLFGIPFIWCSNNLVSSFLTQMRMYQRLSGDISYAEMEAALRDWLFGCNPWGTSMIIGLPKDGVSPKDPHSAFTAVYKLEIPGGLVDGPVYGKIFKSLLGLTLHSIDEFKDFQSELAVYHDDYGDYSTNEPTMDGTAGLTIYLSSLQSEINACVKMRRDTSNGGVVRLDRGSQKIYLAFTGHEFADGGETILKVLKKQKVKGSFFFTGDFYRNPKFRKIITALHKDGHYLGAHSDRHLLYAPWEKRDSLLVTKEQFHADLKANYREMEKFLVEKNDARYFMPPYEWYNSDISAWCRELGITLVNFTPGTYSNADYTTPDMENKYVGSDTIYQRILRYEKNDPDGLNGFILLTHIGTDPKRTDKFYKKLDMLITELKTRGYEFGSFRDLP